MKKIAIMQPYFFPYIGYFQLINAVDKFIIYDDVNYIKKGWINRNRILLNGKEALFTLPLNKASQNKRICDICISEEYAHWCTKFFKMVQNSYNKAPFFTETVELLERVLASENRNLSDFVTNSIVEVCGALQISTEIVKSSATYENQNEKAQGRILDICRQEKATSYINPIGGIDLYEECFFKAEGVELDFLKSSEFEYSQAGTEHVPYLSLLDLLMWCGFDGARGFLDKYELHDKRIR